MTQPIKFNDFYFLGFNALSKEVQVDFLPYFKYLLDTDFAELEDMLKQRLEIKRLNKLTDDDIIAGAIADTLQDAKKKRKNKNYYMCNMVCLMKTIRRIFDSQLYSLLSGNNVPPLAIHNYRYVLWALLTDAEQLGNLYENEMKGDYTYRCNIGRKRVHYMAVHQLLRQSLFGQESAHSFADMETSSAILLIRQLIEIRIRRAFGAVAYLDANDTVQPLDLSRVFDAIRKHKTQIQFPVKLENIERIYKWANLYTHSGQCEFAWLPYYVEWFLRPLTFGEKRGDRWDVRNGIVIEKGVIEEIQSDLLVDKNGTTVKPVPVKDIDIKIEATTEVVKEKGKSVASVSKKENESGKINYRLLPCRIEAEEE